MPNFSAKKATLSSGSIRCSFIISLHFSRKRCSSLVYVFSLCANVLVMPGRFISKEEALKALDAFLNTPYEGGRHQRRIDKIPVK